MRVGWESVHRRAGPRGSDGGVALTAVNRITMNRLKTCVVTALLTVGIAIPLVMLFRAQARLQAIERALRQEVERNAMLQAENERLTQLKAREPVIQRPSDEQYRELMRLRGEVGLLRREAAELRGESLARTNAPSMLRGLKANPGMWKLIRDQQKMAMSMVYKGLAERAHLETNQVRVLNDLLADYVMDNIDQVTAVIQERRSPAEMEQVFQQQEKAIEQKALELMGPEAFAVYQDYTKNLVSHITAEQFSASLPGEAAQKQALSTQLYQVLQEETQRALTSAGLPADYQLVPTFNFRNFASETTAERSLQLLDGIYAQTHARAAGFMTPEQLEKFQGFRTTAIDANRMGIALNRKLMSPGSP